MIEWDAEKEVRIKIYKAPEIGGIEYEKGLNDNTGFI